MKDTMEPLATYIERLPQVTRTFTLYPDKVLVQAKWRFGGQFQNTIPLASLEPNPRTLLIRQHWHKYARWTFAAGAILAGLVIYAKGTTPLPPLAMAGGIIAALGMVLMMMTYRKVPFVRFDPAKKKGAGLDIARAGPDAANFESFIQLLRQHIRDQRRQTGRS